MGRITKEGWAKRRAYWESPAGQVHRWLEANHMRFSGVTNQEMPLFEKTGDSQLQIVFMGIDPVQNTQTGKPFKPVSPDATSEEASAAYDKVKELLDKHSIKYAETEKGREVTRESKLPWYPTGMMLDAPTLSAKEGNPPFKGVKVHKYATVFPEPEGAQREGQTEPYQTIKRRYVLTVNYADIKPLLTAEKGKGEENKR